MLSWRHAAINNHLIFLAFKGQRNFLNLLNTYYVYVSFYLTCKKIKLLWKTLEVLVWHLLNCTNSVDISLPAIHNFTFSFWNTCVSWFFLEAIYIFYILKSGRFRFSSILASQEFDLFAQQLFYLHWQEGKQLHLVPDLF